VLAQARGIELYAWGATTLLEGRLFILQSIKICSLYGDNNRQLVFLMKPLNAATWNATICGAEFAEQEHSQQKLSATEYALADFCFFKGYPVTLYPFTSIAWIVFHP
jgi:hypothetical protein